MAKQKKYTERLEIRISKEQLELLKSHAKADGKTVSQLARDRVTLYCDK